MEYFLIFPGTILCTGITLLYSCGLSSQELERFSGDIQIGTINKQTLIHLSKEQRLCIQKLIALAIVICVLGTSIIATIFIFCFSATIVNFLLCLIIQICTFLLLGRPFYKKMCNIAEKKIKWICFFTMSKSVTKIFHT